MTDEMFDSAWDIVTSYAVSLEDFETMKKKRKEISDEIRGMDNKVAELTAAVERAKKQRITIEAWSYQLEAMLCAAESMKRKKATFCVSAIDPSGEVDKTVLCGFRLDAVHKNKETGQYSLFFKAITPIKGAEDITVTMLKNMAGNCFYFENLPVPVFPGTKQRGGRLKEGSKGRLFHATYTVCGKKKEMDCFGCDLHAAFLGWIDMIVGSHVEIASTVT